MAGWGFPAALAALGALSIGCSGLGKGGGTVEEGCEAGFHACGADCAPDASPLTCGGRCAPCPVPDGGEATCAGGDCGITCHAGYHPCGGGCVDDASVAACGPSCAACAAPGAGHAHAACVADVCGYTCDLGWLVCASGCCEAPRAAAPLLSLGALHSCAVGSGGVLKCWGSNAVGHLGTGAFSPAYSTTPVPVAGFAAGSVAQVGAGFGHTCAVDGAGVVRCWGGNGFGELGDGSWQDAALAVTVLGVSGALSASGGWEHSCALIGNGTGRCWGIGEKGVLGDGHPLGGAVPGVQTVRGLSGAYALVSGYQFNCALTGIASMACWGDNAYGQLGTATSSALEAEPAAVAALSGVTALRAVALGMYHTCVAYDDGVAAGAVRCWGRGDGGQLGNGEKPVAQRTPVEVTGLTGVTALAAGSAHTCALDEAGGVRCWGANSDGQLGDGTFAERLAPTYVSSLASGVVSIAAGAAHTCAALPGPALECWGSNAEGQLGDGSRAGRPAPVQVVQF